MNLMPTTATKPLLTACLAVVCVMPPTLVTAEPPPESQSNWNRFHGYRGEGYNPDGKLPTSWSDDDYTWTRPLGSRDVASPIVAGDSVYLLVSQPDAQEISVQSIELATGRLRWSKSFPQAPHHMHTRNTLAASTPAADDEFVFVAWSDPNHTFLKCFNHEGDEVWSRDFGSWQSQHGFGTSPVIVDDMVVLLNSQQGEQLQPGQTPGTSRMTAVDRNSGATVWETRLTTTRSCYGAPAVVVGGQGKAQQIVASNTGNGLFGIDPENGNMMWSTKVFDARSCSTPLVAGDIAIGTSGSGGGGNNQLVAVRIPKSSEDQPVELYRVKRNAPYVPTPVLKGDRLFMVDDRGIAQCVDVNSGEALWVKRIGGNFGASPIIVGDTMLMISLDGKATLVQAADEFKKLGEVDLGGPVGATPAYQQGNLLLRVDDELRCLGAKSL